MAATKRQREQRKKRPSFDGIDPERRQKEHHAGFERTAIILPENMEMFKPKAGKNYRIDIVPYVTGVGNPLSDEGQYYWERTYYRHQGIGSGEDAYVCLNKTFQESCPICEYRSKAASKGHLDKQSLKDLNYKDRQLFNVFDYGEPDKGVQLWEVSFYNFGKLLDTRVTTRDEDEDHIKFWWFSDAKRKGCTLKITVTEETMGERQFPKVTAIDFKPRTKPIPDEIMDQAACLDELIVNTPYDKLKAIFMQQDDDDSEEDDDEPAPAKKGKKGKKPIDQELDEENEDEELEEFDEEEEEGDEEEEESELGPPPTEKAILKMDRDSLLEVIEDYGLEVDPDKYKRTAMLAKKVAEAAALYEESEDEEEEDEEEEEPEDFEDEVEDGEDEEDFEEEEEDEGEDFEEEEDEELDEDDLPDFEEGDEDEEEEEEEEPPPKKRPAKKKAAVKKAPAKKAPAPRKGTKKPGKK